MFDQSLPRHLEIIYEINRRFLNEVRDPFPRRRGPCPPHVADWRGRRQERPDGAPGHRRQPRHQRCRRAALGAAQGKCAQRLLRDVARAVQQQDQRRDAAPFPRVVQPRAAGAAGPHRRGGLADRSGQAARARTVRRRLLLPGAVARHQAQQQGSAGLVRPGVDRRRTEPAMDFRYPGQADSRVQTPASQRAAHHRAVLPTQAKPRALNSGAGLHLWRQGSSRLLPGQADHQADQRGRGDDQQRPGGQQVPEGRLHPELQRAERAPDLSGCRTSPSRSPPPARKRRAPAT